MHNFKVLKSIYKPWPDIENVRHFLALCFTYVFSLQTFAHCTNCGFAPELMVSPTDYVNCGFNSDDNDASIEYHNHVSTCRFPAVRNLNDEFQIRGDATGYSVGDLVQGNLLSKNEIVSSNSGVKYNTSEIFSEVDLNSFRGRPENIFKTNQFISSQCQYVTNGDFSLVSTGWVGFGSNWSNINGKAQISTNSVTSQTLSQSLSGVSAGALTFNMTLGALNILNNTSSTAKLEVFLDGVKYAEFVNPTGSTLIQEAAFNGAVINGFSLMAGNGDWSYDDLSIAISNYNGSSNPVLAFKFTAPSQGDDFNIDNISLLGNCVAAENCNSIVNGNFSSGTNGWSLGTGWQLLNGSMYNMQDGAVGSVLRQNLKNVPQGNLNFTMTIGGNNCKEGPGYSAELLIRLNGVDYVKFTNPVNNIVPTPIIATLYNGATLSNFNLSVLTGIYDTINFVDGVRLSIPNYTGPSSPLFEAIFSSSTGVCGDDFMIDNLNLITSNDCDADLSVNKTASTLSPTVGSQLTFTVEAKNNGPNAATGVVVNDQIPAGYTLVSATPSTGTWTAPNWTIGNLANGANATLTVVAAVNATGSYANTATITGTEPDPNPGNNTDTETPVPTPAPAPSIALVKTGALSANGNTITYTFTVKNTGNVTLNPVTVTDAKLTPTNVTLLATTLAPGAETTGTATYTVTAAEKTAGQVQNTATATGTPPTGPAVTDVSGTDFTNNTPTVVPVPGADLEIIKVVNKTNPMVGEQVTFTITAKNNGPHMGTGVIVSEVLPTGYTFVSATPSTGTWMAPNWNIGNLANGASATMTMMAIVNATGNYTNVATISGSEEDYNLSNNTSSATVNPNDCINGTNLITNGIFPISGGNTNILPGWTVGGTYGGVWGSGTGRINLSSRGLEFRRDASTITTLEQNLSGVSGGMVLNINDIQWTKTFVNNNTAVFVLDISYGGVVYATVNSTFGNTPSIVAVNGASVNINSLPSVTGNPSRNNPIYSDFANLAITLPNSVSANGDLKFEFVASSDGTEVRDISMKSVSILGCPGADLSITKTASNLTPQIGSQVTFTIAASNAGPAAATGVVVNDPLPAGYTLVSATPSTGTWTAPNWTIGNLANGANATFTVVATVNATGSYANTATITGTEPDPNPGNNTDTETPVPTPAPAPSIALVKTGALSANGNTITYTFTVRNTGNVTLNPVTVNDSKLTTANVTLAATSLAPGAETTGTATYTVTTAEKTAGQVQNTATATGTPPTGPAVTDVSGTDFTNNNPTVVPVPNADLQVTKVVSDEYPSVGGQVTFTVTARNNGPSNATGVVVTDALPSGYVFLNATPSTGVWSAPNWTIGNLANGASASMTIVATVAGTGNHENTATITGNQPDPTPGNNTDSAITYPGSGTDLEVTKTPNNFTPNVGDQITFTVSAKNNGPRTGTGVTVTDVLPSGYTFVSAAPSQGVWSAPVWSVGTLASGASATMTMVATVNPTGNYTNTAVVSGVEPDPTPENNTATVTPDPSAITDLEVTKVVNNQTPSTGEQVTFTITAKNNGPRNATGVVVNDQLPSGYTYVSHTASIGSWTAPNWSVGNMASGASATLTIVATVNATGAYANTATIKGEQPDDKPDNNTDTEVTSPGQGTDLEVIKTVDITSPNVGDQVTFTITAKNNGPRNATGVVVTDQVPSGFVVLNATPSIGTWNSPSWNIGNLSNGASATLTIVATVSASGNFTNVASIDGNETDPNPGNNEDEVTTPAPENQADLQVTKLADTMAPNVGSQVTFTITAKNNGPKNATGVVVTDQIPSGYVVLSVTPDRGVWAAPNWSIGNLANGASTSMTVVAVVAGTGNYANTATITGNQVDPNPDNNTSTVTPVPPASTPSIALVKTGVLSTDGNTITYGFTVTNTGNTTLTNVSVNDPKLTPSNVTLLATSLAAGASTTGTGTYTVTVADRTAGSVSNTATATGTPPTGGPVTDISGTTQTNDTPTVVPVACVPDLNPAITVLPNNGISGQRDMVVLLDVKEILGCATRAGQEIRVSVAKVSDFSFNWTPYAAATTIPEAAVTGLENARWTFSETTTAWVWVYNAGVMNANEISNIGFMGIWNAGASSGKLNFTVTIRNGSGGEVNTLNNVDYETVTYDVAP
jgi:uncharacterized repeat protein (TIGR01451 family)